MILKLETRTNLFMCVRCHCPQCEAHAVPQNKNDRTVSASAVRFFLPPYFHNLISVQEYSLFICCHRCSATNIILSKNS